MWNAIRLSMITILCIGGLSDGLLHAEDATYAPSGICRYNGRSYRENTQLATKIYQENDIVFYVYPPRSLGSGKITLKDFLARYADGFEDKDLSNSIITLGYRPGYWESDDGSVPGFSVTLKEFQSTKNFKTKTLKDVDFYDVIGHLSFRGWTLENVDFSGAVYVSLCDFTDAKISTCSFWGGEVGTIKRGEQSFCIPTLRTTQTITFHQFSSTWSFKHDKLDQIYFMYIDLTDWDFTGKDISGMVFSECMYYGELIRGDGRIGKGLTADYFQKIKEQKLSSSAESVEEQSDEVVESKDSVTTSEDA